MKQSRLEFVLSEVIQKLPPERSLLTYKTCLVIEILFLIHVMCHMRCVCLFRIRPYNGKLALNTQSC